MLKNYNLFTTLIFRSYDPGNKVRIIENIVIKRFVNNLLLSREYHWFIDIKMYCFNCKINTL